MSAGRRLALRAIVWQAGATALAVLVFLILRGAPSALAAAVGGLAVVSAAWVSARVALGGGVQPAGVAVGRLLLGVVLKWVVVIVVLAMGFAGFHLPPLPMLVGVLAATLALLPANLLNR